jgi:hypothetical protein
LQLVEGLRRESSECGQLVLPGMYKAYARPGQWLNVNTLVYGACTVLLVAGWWQLARRHEDPLLMVLPFYMALCAIVPWETGTRYLLPMLPVLTASAWPMIEKLSRRYTVVCALVVVHAAVAIGYWAREAKNVRWHSDWPEVAAVLSPFEGKIHDTGIYCVRTEQAMMLWVEANRRLPIYEEPNEIDPAVKWLITMADEPAAPGFAQAWTAGQFKALVKQQVVRTP